MEETDLQPYLAQLEALPFVKRVRCELQVQVKNQIRPDAILHLRTPKGEQKFWVEIIRTHLTRPLIDGLLFRKGKMERKNRLFLAPYVGGPIGRYLRKRGVNYLDAAGNCFLAVKKNYLALVEGKRQEKWEVKERGIRGPGHKVLFAILVRPVLLNAPVRNLGDAAGVGKTAAAEMLKRLKMEGLIGIDLEGKRLLKPKVLLDRWIAGYTAAVRPRLLFGRYRTNDPTPEVLENRIEKELGEDITWAWGGGAAAIRLTRYYRGPETILHLANKIPDLGMRLKGIPDKNGPLIVLGVPGRIAFEGLRPKTIHPLLVYTELLLAGHERALEGAERIRERFLKWPSP